LPNIPSKKIDKVNKDSDRDYWMKAEEAKSYGMVDEVLGLAK
jgi:ATP-dependent Clp protease protease subunit